MDDPRRFDVIVTITGEEGNLLPDPDKFAAAARHAGSSRDVVDGDLMFAFTAQKVITSMAISGLPNEPSAMAFALAVVSEALRLAPPCPQGRGAGSL